MSAKSRAKQLQPAADIEELASVPLSAIRSDLLAWYDAGHRSLPWRLESPPGVAAPSSSERAYAVWVSEVMLQQTQVERVKEYYRKWMARWPTVSHLARASLDEVREQWQGLGYYRRARFLLEAAQLELLSALEPLVGAGDTGPLPLKQTAPTLKALWECQASLTLPFPPHVTPHFPYIYHRHLFSRSSSRRSCCSSGGRPRQQLLAAAGCGSLPGPFWSG